MLIKVQGQRKINGSLGLPKCQINWALIAQLEKYIIGVLHYGKLHICICMLLTYLAEWLSNNW
jgi:hypothetical protein